MIFGKPFFTEGTNGRDAEIFDEASIKDD